MRQNSPSASYFRNFIFGVEDSLVSTIGLLSGVAVAGVDRKTIFITGIILILVEAISMAAGSFLSERSVQEYVHQSDTKVKKPITAGAIMFFSYFISGFVPLSPYAIWPVDMALKLSVLFSVAALFILGLVSGKMSKTSMLADALRMMVIGGIAIGVGMLAGAAISLF